MKIIYTKYALKGYTINLFGVAFARPDREPLSGTTINHESIHTAQGKELLWIFFYIWYGIEWVIRLIQYRNRKKAYRNISFEREAYSNDENTTYLTNRKLYSFLNYLKLKNNG
ncbi:MAG: hypothetical protein ACK5LF_21365 [Bacteroides xylanisolvens]